MQHTRLGVVLITALEVIAGVHAHIARRHLDILVVGDVDTGRVVHLIVCARSDGEAADGTLAMIKDGIDIWREDALIVVVDLHGRVGPPQECLRHVGAVIQHALYLKVCTAGTQGEARHSLLMEHLLHLAHPHCDAAVLVLLYARVDRHIG